MKDNHAHSNQEISQSEYQQFAFHPHNILMVLVIVGLSAIFASLSAAFVYTRVQSNLPPIKLPNIFMFNTLILLAGSAMMMRAKKAYLADNTQHYQRSLLFTAALSFIFLCLQWVGWRTLLAQQITINSDNSASYLYIISILHLLHVIGGLPFLIIFLYNSYRFMKEPVSVLVYFSDPEKRLQLRLLTLYWHFLDLLWVYLVLFFFINYLIR